MRHLTIKDNYDMVVIGGGCNGLATAWDAALRGLSVLLLEKEDFGWATSAWNSRLIHGGLKYLEKYDVALVRESLREREWLLKAAPHLVKPLRFFLPFYKNDTYKPWFLRLGMLAYDVLSFDKSTPWHRQFSRRGFLNHIPSVNSKDFAGGAAYFETQVAEPERLMNELALSARDAGAQTVNHARVDGVIRASHGIAGVEFTDTLTGKRHSVHAAIVVNAAGPWVDEVVMSLRDHQNAPRLMGGTKGTHLIVDTFPGAPSEAIYFEAKSDSRPLLVIPWRGRYLLGSTDERFGENLDTATPSDAEIDYILAETNTVIPSAGLTRDDVLWCYAGVRPLPHTEGGPTSDITRRHVVMTHDGDLNGLISIIGGKLTTFRQLGEDVVDAAGKALGRRLPRSTTKKLRLAGASDGDNQTVQAGRLRELYGTRAKQIEAIAARTPRLAQPLAPGMDVIAAEIVYAVEDCAAATIGDVVARRIMTGLDDDLGTGSLSAVGEILQEFCGWTEERLSHEVDAYMTYIQKMQPRKVRML